MVDKCKISNGVCALEACTVQRTLEKIVQGEQSNSNSILERLLGGGYRGLENRLFEFLEERLNLLIENGVNHLYKYSADKNVREDMENRLIGKAYEEFMYLAVLLMKKLKKVIGDQTSSYSKFYNLLTSDNSIVLPPTATLELYQALHPEEKKIEHPFNTRSLAKISVPDGVIVEPGKIAGVLEYTLTKHNFGEYCRGKINGFYMDAKRCIPLFNEASLIFLGPEGKSYGDMVKSKIAENTNYLSDEREVKFIGVPLNLQNLRGIVYNVYNKIIQEFNKQYPNKMLLPNFS